MAKRTPEQYEALILNHMRSLGCTREEAIDLIECDDEIDHGNTELFALTAEQKKLVRQVTKADRDPEKRKSVKRERKVDEDKKILIEMLEKALTGCENVSVKNEAEISFIFNENTYTVKLTKHRAKKA